MRLIGSIPLALLLGGCDDTDFHGGEPQAVTESCEVADDACGVAAIYTAHCYGCHDAAAATAGLDLESEHVVATVGVTSALYGPALLVSPNEPQASLLYLKVTGAQAVDQGDSMPPGGTLGTLSAYALSSWIQKGATEDCAPAPDTGAR